MQKHTKKSMHILKNIILFCWFYTRSGQAEAMYFGLIYGI